MEVQIIEKLLSLLAKAISKPVYVTKCVSSIGFVNVSAVHQCCSKNKDICRSVKTS